MPLAVRERPPLRRFIEAEAPNGRRYRWAQDEPNPANAFSALRHSNAMPGGFESMDAVLPRKPGIEYSDLDRLSTLRVMKPGGGVVSETRLERAPRASGSQRSISPSAVGWQAHLEDNKAATLIGRDADLSRWQGPAVQRKINLLGSSIDVDDPATTPDATTGAPSVDTGFDGAWARAHRSEAWYDAGSLNRIGALYYAWKRNGSGVNNADANWDWLAFLSSDDVLSSSQSSGSLRAAGPDAGTLTATASYRFAMLHLAYAAAAGADGQHYAVYWRPVVYGDHGLPVQGTEPNAGLLASDIEAYAIGKWAPRLNFIAGETILPSSFVIPHLALIDPTTAAEIIKQAIRFELRDWAVWENRTYYSNDRGARGRSWRARVAPAELSETGPQVDRLYESVVVQFSDVDGTAKTVGPPGSGADTEDSQLKDSDPENPANKLGITRRALLQMGTATAASAIQTGVAFLLAQKDLDTSGQAKIVGFVEDDRGVVHPYDDVRGGDSIVFTDAADPSPRRIVKADCDHKSATATIDLDSPPEGMAALLERLGVVLIPLGLST